jgi:phage terminase small subunit
MAPLRNPRHERFCQFLLQGETAIDAHEKAGYARDDGNATRLAKNPAVIERLTELQNAVAEKTQVTVESLINELEEARKRADSLDQLSAVVKAISEKARISGLMVQNVEVGGPGDFSACETVEAVVGELVKYSLNPSYQIATERDRQELINITERHFAEMQEVIDAIKARPVAGVHVETLHRPAIGNGKSRP